MKRETYEQGTGVLIHTEEVELSLIPEKKISDLEVMLKALEKKNNITQADLDLAKEELIEGG